MIRNKTRVSSFTIIIQHSSGNPSYSNQRRKRNKRYPDQERSKVLIVCSWHDTVHAAKSLQTCPTLCWPHRQQPTRLLRPWDSPGKNTGVGCHFLLQCMKVKSEREVAQSCPTLSDPMDCSPPGSSTHGIFQARVLEWGAIAFSVLYVENPKDSIRKLPELI